MFNSYGASFLILLSMSKSHIIHMLGSNISESEALHRNEMLQTYFILRSCAYSRDL